MSACNDPDEKPPSPRLAYLRSVDYFSQRPHQGAVHSHQLLRLYLVSLVQHNPGAGREQNHKQTLSVQADVETEQNRAAGLCGRHVQQHVSSAGT